MGCDKEFKADILSVSLLSEQMSESLFRGKGMGWVSKEVEGRMRGEW